MSDLVKKSGSEMSRSRRWQLGKDFLRKPVKKKLLKKCWKKNHLACNSISNSNSISILAASVSKRKIMADVNISVAKTVAVIHLSGVREGAV